MKASCPKCFKDVDLTPDSRCSVCGTDLSEKKLREDYANLKKSFSTPLTEQIGYALFVLGAMLLIGGMGRNRGGFSLELIVIGLGVFAAGTVCLIIGRFQRKSID